MYNSQTITRKRGELVSKIVMEVLLLVLLAGILVISWWSFEQTHFFFTIRGTNTDAQAFGTTADDPYISWALAILFQYGQNPAIFLAVFYWKRMKMIINITGRVPEPKDFSRVEYEKARNNFVLWSFAFVFFAIVDSGTNIAMVNSAGFVGLTLWVMRLVAIAVVFVEEFFMKILSIFFSVFNDCRQLLGYRRIDALDIDDYTGLDTGDLRKSTATTEWGSSRGASQTQSSLRKPVAATVSRPVSKPLTQSSFASQRTRPEPTYHPAYHPVGTGAKSEDGGEDEPPF